MWSMCTLGCHCTQLTSAWWAFSCFNTISYEGLTSWINWPQWEQSRGARAVWSRIVKMKPLDYDMPWQRLWWTFAATWVTEKNLLIYSLQFHWICGYSRRLLHWQWEHSTWRMQHQLNNFQTWSFDLSMFYANPKSRWALLQWPGIF